MGLSPAQFLLRQVIQGRAPSSGPSGPTAIFVSSLEAAEDAATGTLIGTLLTAGGTAPYTYSLLSDPDSLLAIDGDALEVGAALTGVETYAFTLRTTDANALTFDQEFTLTVVAAVENPSGIEVGDGNIVVPDPEDPEIDEGGYEEPPVQQNTNDGLKINGKNSGSATFLKDWGAPVPGAVYTMRYTADWSLMGRQGREAAVGFAFKAGNSFHLASLRGDGSTPATMLKSKVHGDFRKANQFTITNDGSAAHGTKDGPNWLQIAISTDGSTYTLRTSADGSAWTDAYTAAVPVPLGAADDATQFGPAGYFSTQDKGVFSIVIETFGEVLLPQNTVLPAITGTAMSGESLSCSTGTWVNGVDSYAYQWLADDQEIDGATANTLVIAEDRVASVIKCRVTATNGAGSVNATSTGTAAVVSRRVAFLEYRGDGGGSPHSFTGLNFGEEHADRWLIAVFTPHSGGAFTPGDVTIGGVPAAVAVSSPGLSASSGHCHIAYAKVPTGTSGTVDCVGGPTNAGMALYRVVRSSMTPHDTVIADGTGSPLSGTIDCPAGGFIVAGCAISVVAGDMAWAGLTAEDYDTTLETTRRTGAHDNFTLAQSGLTVGVTGAAGATKRMAAASWP